MSKLPASSVGDEGKSDATQAQTESAEISHIFCADFKEKYLNCGEIMETLLKW